MEEYRGLSRKDCRKLSLKCMFFSILGMMILYFTNYNPDLRTYGMPKELFIGMMASAAMILLVGIVGLIVSSVNGRKGA